MPRQGSLTPTCATIRSSIRSSLEPTMADPITTRLQVSLTHRTGPLSVRANYTWSKSIDVGSGDGSGFSSPIDNFNLRLMRGISDQNRPHSFNGTLATASRWAEGLPSAATCRNGSTPSSEDWDLGSIIVLQSGAPYTVSSSRPTAAIPGNTRANYSATDTNIGQITRRGDGVFFFTRRRSHASPSPERAILATLLATASSDRATSTSTRRWSRSSSSPSASPSICVSRPTTCSITSPLPVSPRT